MSLTFFLCIAFLVVVALIFDFINGFHDAANAIATIVSTQVLRPTQAVLLAAISNFFAMLVFAPKVAETISQIVKIEPKEPIYLLVIFAGLCGAITWNLLTWFIGFPTSSSHALIGSVAGAGIAHMGWQALHWDKLLLIFEFIIIAPLMGMALSYIFMLIAFFIFHRYRRPIVNKIFRKGQLVSAAFYSLGHGGNDAQKTMGVILAMLIAAGILSPESKLSLANPSTAWIIISCQLALGLGTAFGGWRIVKTMGMKITKLKPISGFCAESAGAVALFFSTAYGIPVSTTHTITGSILGVGIASNGPHKVRWEIAYRIIVSWILTIPASACMSAIVFWILAAIIK
jgi:inorganic phosphate transporter, PiT family